MTLDELQKITGGTWIQKPKKGEVHNFNIDSRKLEKGDTYIALKGTHFDGHTFLKEVAQKKAFIAIVSAKPKEKIKQMGVLLVKDTLEALQKIAHYKRIQFPISLIAVTGSVGKTTLKELITTVLESHYKVLKSEGNQNNQIGLPLTLLKLNQEYDVAVTELGMNHLKEISQLSKICNPNISLITNIGTSHIGYLGSKKNIFKAKMEICDGMEKGVLIVNGRDKYLKKIKTNNKITCIKCGSRHSEISIGKVTITDSKTIFPIFYKKKAYQIEFPYPGAHYPMLITMAISVGLQMNIDMEACIQRCEKFQMVGRRLNIENLKNHITLIDDSYNASLESFLSVLEILKKEKRPKLLIVGDILELGDYSKKIHLKLIKKLNKVKNAEVWMVGKELEHLQKYVHMGTFFSSIEKMKTNILENEWKNCTILVKGSNAMRLGEISDLIKEKYRQE